MEQEEKLLEKALDNNLLNIEYINSEIMVLTFFGDIKGCFYYGGFVIDKNLNIIKASCNIIEKRTVKRFPIQFITKSDGCNLRDLLGTVSYGKDDLLSLLLPKPCLIEMIPDSRRWMDDIVIPFKKHELCKYAPLHRAYITTEDYIINTITDLNIEKSLNNQLCCAELLKSGLDNVADKLNSASMVIGSGLNLIGRSIDNGGWGLPQ